jgi:hypothetical protein
VFVSDSEPGFYEDGKFGCRIEDIVRIVRANVPYKFRELNYLTFETVSLVPIQTKMLLPEMLTKREVSTAFSAAAVDTGSCKQLVLYHHVSPLEFPFHVYRFSIYFCLPEGPYQFPPIFFLLFYHLS